MSYKLLVETPDIHDFEYVVEEKNMGADRSMWIKGVYMMANEVNKNQRMYPLEEMAREVKRYHDDMISPGRAMGELNHPTTADVNLERACHLVTEMQQSGNYFIGKSKVLSTPMGKIVENLIQDGVKVGMSSRALGKLNEEGGTNVVEDMKLVAIDCVADPSCSKAFVNGILESKQWILGKDGDFLEAYDQFETGIATLPKHDVETYIKDQVLSFITQISR